MEVANVCAAMDTFIDQDGLECELKTNELEWHMTRFTKLQTIL